MDHGYLRPDSRPERSTTGLLGELGRLGRFGKVECYRAGEQYVVSLDAGRVDTPSRPVTLLLDERGRRVR